MGFFDFLGFGNKIKQALKNGAVIIDVRTAQEFDQGRAPGSINIPVDRIGMNIDRIRSMNKPVVLCCASGVRADQALRVLKNKGITDVYNGGSWERIWRMQQSA